MSGRIVYFDCASGASGDMLLGALVDLGLPVQHLEAELAKLELKGYRLETSRVLRSGLEATKVDVILEEPHGGHSHDHGHDQHEHHHHHRGLREIRALLEGSGLEPVVQQRCGELFQRLAEAEATVHGTSPEEVHFHEVGAVDSIVDIVGGVVGLAWLKAERFVASPLNVGSGNVTMSHGTFPVPPPATARLVQGAPVYGEGEGELLTPTGALLVTSYVEDYGPLPLMRPEAVGYGAGSRETPGRPNALRIVMGEPCGSTEQGHRVWVLETQLDDMSPQLFSPLVERLLEAGALDVYGTPIYMKKGRPGLLVTLLCEDQSRLELEELLFSETTTLGVRRVQWERTVLEREVIPVTTTYGTIGVKLGRRGDRVYNAQPEFEDCRRAADEAGVPLKEVWAEALAAFRSGR